MTMTQPQILAALQSTWDPTLDDQPIPNAKGAVGTVTLTLDTDEVYIGRLVDGPTEESTACGISRTDANPPLVIISLDQIVDVAVDLDDA